MTAPTRRELDALWARHHAEWRDPAQIVSQWDEARRTDPALLDYTTRGAWWEVLAESGITLIVTREYEHLVMALNAANGRPAISFVRLPHPSGLAIDRRRRVVYLASTRNPNQVIDFRPATGLIPRLDMAARPVLGALMPVRSRYYPGSLYMHDLALVGGVLHANAVGQNAVVRLEEGGRYRRVWWPRCIESEAGPVFGRNHLQLNSIAAGADLRHSFFSASAARLSARRPGHRNFPVDGRGVIFSGATREPMASGLTRPHSARLHRGRLWVANSGYGELGWIEAGRFAPGARLPGWTRGLCLHGPIAFVGTSRVIPRFRHYAPGLDEAASLCGVHAVEIKSGRVLGSLVWPRGNQIFALDWAPAKVISGFPFSANRRNTRRQIQSLFYAYQTAG
jgi:uncharacterized protein (TIGR03032 family)